LGLLETASVNDLTSSNDASGELIAEIYFKLNILNGRLTAYEQIKEGSFDKA
jgi:hypothetical protein